MTRKTVTLRTAFHWTCEECGRDHFSVSVKAEFGPGEREAAYRSLNELADYAELPDGWDQFEMVTKPDTVTCEHCLQIYDTEDDRLEE